MSGFACHVGPATVLGLQPRREPLIVRACGPVSRIGWVSSQVNHDTAPGSRAQGPAVLPCWRASGPTAPGNLKIAISLNYGFKSQRDIKPWFRKNRS
jgi:hypothetical protein